MKRHFYFFRHGQTNENKSGVTYGNALEAYLTDDGIAQAKKLGEYLSDKDIEVVYSSPLKRAIHTAEIAVNNPNVEIITDDRLRLKRHLDSGTARGMKFKKESTIILIV